MRVAAVVLAAGKGERLGADAPKAFVSFGGKTLLERSLEVLASSDEIHLVVPVVPPERLSDPAVPGAQGKVVGPVPGGARRQDSVAAGLASLPDDIGWLAVHDAARCLVSPDDVDRVIAAAKEGGAAILAHRSPDTVKIVEDGVIVSTPERASCWAAQTPQVFRVELLREGLEKAEAEGFTATDDAELVERLGVEVRVVESSSMNLKITHPADLLIAEALVGENRGRS